jgi:hypothetical protein
MARFAFILCCALLGAWLLGAMLQGVLLRLAVTSHRLWLFQFWFEKFAWGITVGFVLGFVAGLALLRRRPEV